MERGRGAFTAPSFFVAPTQVPRSGTGELVTAVFTASEPKLDAGFQVTGKGNGTAIFPQRERDGLDGAWHGLGSCTVERIDYRW